jgi:hypothetical protein
MCDRCKTIERQLLNFRQVQASTDDRLAVVMLAEAIIDLEAEASSMHPVSKTTE